MKYEYKQMNYKLGRYFCLNWSFVPNNLVTISELDYFRLSLFTIKLFTISFKIYVKLVVFDSKIYWNMLVYSYETDITA